MLPFPPLRNIPDPEIEPASLLPPALQADSLPVAPPGKPLTLHKVFLHLPKPSELVSLLQPMDNEPLFPAIWFCPGSLFEIQPHPILQLMSLLVYYTWAML